MIKALTVATEKTDGLTRLMDSAKRNGIDLSVIGLDGHWTGGDVPRLENPGGGQKINFVKKYIQDLDDACIVVIVDGYDVVFTGGLDQIIERFRKHNCKALFAAERTCWPDPNLADKYPETFSPYKFLNSGTFVAEVAELKKIISEPIQDTDDDQLYYSLKYISGEFDMKLDYECSLFQPTEGCWEDVQYLDKASTTLKNTLFNSHPLVIHGNGSPRAKIFFNRVCDYVVREPANPVELNPLNYPEVTPKSWKEVDEISIFAFLRTNKNIKDFFLGLVHLNYPKDKISLHVCTTGVSLSEGIIALTKEYSTLQVKNVSSITPSVREEAFSYAKELERSYCFFIDDVCILNNPYFFHNAINSNKNIVAPMLRVEGSWAANFWRGVSDDGWYEEFPDYFEIADSNYKGLWNCPHISSCLFMTQSAIQKSAGKFELNYTEEKGDFITFCANLRNSGDFIYLDNREIYGYLTEG